MSTKLAGNSSQHIKMFERTQNKRNSSSTYTDSSSDEELTPRNKKLLRKLDLPGSSGKAYGKRKLATKNRFRASQKQSTRASVGMHNLEKFSKSLIKDLKVESKKMLVQFKKDLRNVAAANSSRNTTNNSGRHILNTSQARAQITPHSGAGQFSTNTGLIHHERRVSLTTMAVNRPAGYFTNLIRQVSNPVNLSYAHPNNTQTFVMGSAGFSSLPMHRRLLGDASHIPNRTVANSSLGGGPIIFPRSSHGLTDDNVQANRFRHINFHENFEMNEAWLRRHGRRNGDSH